MPEFDTALARAVADDDADEYTFEFTVNERDPESDAIVNKVKCKARAPGEGELLILMTDVMGRRTDLGTKLAGIVDFLTEVLDDESKQYVVDRLLDYHDPFGIEDLTPILEWMVEEWSGRPTRQPSDFAPSRKTGGQTSTRRTSKSTSSGSRRTAS